MAQKFREFALHRTSKAREIVMTTCVVVVVGVVEWPNADIIIQRQSNRSLHDKVFGPAESADNTVRCGRRGTPAIFHADYPTRVDVIEFDDGMIVCRILCESGFLYGFEKFDL